MGTLSVNTSKTTSYAKLDAGYCFCVYTLNRKCHILSVNVTKHFNSTSKTTRPPGQAGRGRGHNCHEVEAEASFWVSRPRPGRGRCTPGVCMCLSVSPSVSPSDAHFTGVRCGRCVLFFLGVSKSCRTNQTAHTHKYTGRPTAR